MVGYLSHLSDGQETVAWVGFAALCGWFVWRAGGWVVRTFRVRRRLEDWWAAPDDVLVGEVVAEATMVLPAVSGRHDARLTATGSDGYVPAHGVRGPVTSAFEVIARDAGHPVRRHGPPEKPLPYTRSEQPAPPAAVMARWARHYLPRLSGAEQLALWDVDEDRPPS